MALHHLVKDKVPSWLERVRKLWCIFGGIFTLANRVMRKDNIESCGTVMWSIWGLKKNEVGWKH